MAFTLSDNLTLNKVRHCINTALQKELIGDYENAYLALHPLWPDVSAQPQTDFLPENIEAEVFLRCGSVAGYLGNARRMPDLQEHARDLLTKARMCFSGFDEGERIAECENALAQSYWRTGAYDEAQIWLSEALSHDLENASSVRTFTHVLIGMVFLSMGKPNETYQHYQTNFPIISQCQSDFIKGCFFTNFGLALKNLNQIIEAQENLKQALTCFVRCQNKLYAGLACNNLARLFQVTGDFRQAHVYASKAIDIYTLVGDETRSAGSLDTKAQIYLDERKFSQALVTIDKSIASLEKSNAYGVQVESMLTKAKILVCWKKLPEALSVISEARQLAFVQVNTETAQTIVNEFSQFLENFLKARQPLRRIFVEKAENEELLDDDLELIVPENFPPVESLSGLWISTNRLAHLGLHKGCFALVAEENISPGALAVVVEKDSDEGLCGYIDFQFGLVVLEANYKNIEPILLSEENAQIIGRIVGFGTPSAGQNGVINIQPID